MFSSFQFFTPQSLRVVRVLFLPMVSGWAGRRLGGGKKIVWAVSQKTYGVGSSYLLGTLVREV